MAKTEIAMNTAPKATMFTVTDYKIVGDYVIVPEALMKELS